MARRILVSTAQLAPGTVMRYVLDGRLALAIYNVDGEFQVTSDTCTHGEASLADGEIEGDEIVCPFHRGAFDIRSGEATRPPCLQALATYAVEIVDGMVTIEL
jgi:nitrite reductase/ring-hydroxylating ferredoxin subunit